MYPEVDVFYPSPWGIYYSNIEINSQGIITSRVEPVNSWSHRFDSCEYLGYVYFLGENIPVAGGVPCYKGVSKLVNNQLVRIENMHYHRQNSSSVALSDRLYAIGGYDYDNYSGYTMEYGKMDKMCKYAYFTR